MANEFKHGSVGSQLSQTEWEGVGTHVLDSQAAGDIIYASSTSQLSRLGIGTAGKVLMTNSGASAPEWSAAITGVTSILATDLKIGEDDQTKIDFETADEIHFYAANVEQVYLGDNIFGPQTDSDVDLGSTGVRWKDAFVDSITVTGEVDGASLDISGNADIDGTTNLDAVDIDGAVQIDATVTIGADDQGYDIIFYGDTASANLTWDTSADDLILNGGAGLVVPDGQLTLGSTAIAATATEINTAADGNTSVGTTAVADGDGIVTNDGGTMRQTTVQTFATYFASEITGMSNLATVGTITSGTWNGTAIDGDYINDNIISGQAEITSGLATADELLYSDAGTVKRVGVDTFTSYLAGVMAGTVTSTGISDSSGVLTLDIQNMTASSTVADADLVVIDDGAGGTLRKMTRANFIESAALDAINIDGGAIDGVTLGTNSAVTQAVIDNININGTTIGHTSDTDLLTLTSANLAVAGDIEVSGSVEVATIDYTDGDNAVTIADGGGVTFAQDVSTTDAKYIKLGGSRMATAEPASDSTGYGIVIGFDSAGSVSAGDAVYINSSGKVAQANANAGSVTDPAIGIATNAAGSDGDDCYVLTHGIWRLDAEAFTAGDPVYVGESAGALTKDIPNDDGDYVQRIGVAVSDDVIFVMPSIDVIEHA